MSRPFSSGSGFTDIKALGIVFALIFLGISWLLAPYTVINCYQGSCSITRGDERLESFEMSEVEDCKVIMKTKRKKRRNSSSYYPVIVLKSGREIRP